MGAFLKGKIKFLDIYNTIEETLRRTAFVKEPRYDDYVAINTEARAYASELTGTAAN